MVSSELGMGNGVDVESIMPVPTCRAILMLRTENLPDYSFWVLPPYIIISASNQISGLIRILGYGKDSFMYDTRAWVDGARRSKLLSGQWRPVAFGLEARRLSFKRQSFPYVH